MKRILKDTVAAFIELPLSVFQMDFVGYWVPAAFCWIAIPVAFIWLIIKTLWSLILVPKNFHNKGGAIFLGYALLTSIATLVLKYFLPELGDKLAAFEPISIDMISERLNAWFYYCNYHLGDFPGFYHPIKGITYIILAIIWLIIMAITGVFTYGLTYIPVFAYIWLILFVCFLFAAVSEFKYGRDNAWVDFAETVWNNYIYYSFAITLDMCLSLYLYMCPIVNVIVYRHRLKYDKRKSSYPPLNGKRLDHEKLSHCSNHVYSRLIK